MIINIPTSQASMLSIKRGHMRGKKYKLISQYKSKTQSNEGRSKAHQWVVRYIVTNALCVRCHRTTRSSVGNKDMFPKEEPMLP